MIETDAAPAFAALAARLAGKARRLAEARSASRRLASRQPEKVWRSAQLLWPLFTKG